VASGGLFYLVLRLSFSGNKTDTQYNLNIVENGLKQFVSYEQGIMPIID